MRRPATPGVLDPAWVAERAALIRERLPLREVEGTGVRLHLAAPGSRLSEIAGSATPYWAYAWPGDRLLARHLLERPETLRDDRGRPRGLHVLGSGAGLAAIVAGRLGSREARLYDADPLAHVAARLNFAANGLAEPHCLLAWPDRASPAMASLVLAGDVFYDAQVARAAAATLDGWQGDAERIVGDVGRRSLPLDRLEPLASYPVADVGDPPGVERMGTVYRWRPP